MSVVQGYENLATEVLNLKKAWNAEKLAHQATITQLETSYSLNQELQAVIKSQGIAIKDLNKQNSDKSLKLTELSQLYEAKLYHLREEILSRENELQGIRGSLLTTDYDMIRLRVVSELELGHQEQMEIKEKEIERLTEVWQIEVREKQIVIEKCEHYKKEIETLIAKHISEIEIKDEKYIRESNKIHEKYEKERLLKKETERSLESSEKRYRGLLEKYEEEMNRVYDNSPTILRNENNDELRKKIVKLETSLEDKNREIENLQKKLDKEMTKNQQSIIQMEKNFKDLKNESISYDEFLGKIKEKEQSNEETVLSYEKKIKNLKENQQEELQRMKRECDKRIDEERLNLEFAKTIKENCSLTSNEPLHSLSLEREKILEDKIRKLEIENQNLSRKVTKHENISSNVTRRVKDGSIEYTNDRSVELVKVKLKEANSVIVNLLREKASLKQEIQKRIN